MTTRFADCFAACAKANRPALGIFTMAGDPDLATGVKILAALPAAGADFIELGMPFSDPMADGPGVQAAGQRALAGGQTLNKTLAMVAEFRKSDATTPILLMGYYNPIYSYGVERFLTDAGYMGADTFSMADIAGFTITTAVSKSLPWEKLPRLAAWRDRIAQRPAVQQAMTVFDR